MKRAGVGVAVLQAETGYITLQVGQLVSRARNPVYERPQLGNRAQVGNRVIEDEQHRSVWRIGAARELDMASAGW